MEPQEKVELPRAFEEADVDHLVVLIADMLDRLMKHNDQIPLSPESLTRFHSRTPPSISVLEYLRRIVKYANVERTCLLITLHYIDQICARMPHFTLSSLTCHRFIIAAVVVASKALCDAFCSNTHYAKVGGIRVGELNLLEKEFLAAIDWRLTSTKEVLDAYYVNLIRTHSTGMYELATPTSPLSTSSLGAGSDLGSASPGEMSPRLSVFDETTPTPSDLSAETTVASVGIDIMMHDKITVDNPRPSVEPSTVLIERATLSPVQTSGPTVEQHLAFAALQEQNVSHLVKRDDTAEQNSPVVEERMLKRQGDALAESNRPRSRLRKDGDDEDLAS